MIKINKIHYVIFFLRLAELQSTTISDHTKDKQHNNIDVSFNTDQYNTNNRFDSQSDIQTYLENSFIKANGIRYSTPNFGEDVEEELMPDPVYNTKALSPETNCWMDDLKLAFKWWSYSNGTLKETNLHVLSYPQRQLDLSYHYIDSNEKLLTLIPHRPRYMKIVILSLAYNNLTIAPYKTLHIMENSLICLSLRGNPFVNVNSKDTGLHSQYCPLNKENIKLPKNKSSPISSINGLLWATFPYMPALLELDISNCNIEYIGKNAFKNLTNLQNLYMSHNKILMIPADTFLYTPSLQMLDLSFNNAQYDSSFINNIKTASPNFELIMKLLYRINIADRAFWYLPQLKYLDVSHSKLSRSSAKAFRKIGPNLKYLNLCYTAFPMFGSGIFKNSSLIGLDLSGNTNAGCLLTKDVFVGLSESLTFLFFENSNLIDLAWLKPLRKLTVLALAGNNINNLVSENFRNLKQLQLLDLTSNQIGNWYSQVFKHNEKLNILGLRGNNINVITKEMVKDFNILTYLSLGNNNFICDCLLRDIVDIAAVNYQRAQCNQSFWLDLVNSIQIKSVRLYHHFVKNSRTFSHNNFSNVDIPSLILSQNLHKLVQSTKDFMKEHHFASTNKTKIKFILSALRNHSTSKVCSHSHTSAELYNGINSTLLKLHLLDYKDEHYWCYNETDRQHLSNLNCQRSSLVDDIEQELSKLTNSVLATVFSLILIALLSFLIYIKRWHIYYYYSAVKSAALFSVISKDKITKFNSLWEQNSGMVYDIFLSYCQGDRDWIVEEFIPNIEKDGDISICLHERDFEVGVTILDNIVSCMERSKALMLIISCNFLLSHWCQFEMQLAQHHIVELHKNNLILVLLEHIPRSKRPKSLQFLMTVKTYIEWPGCTCNKPNDHSDDCKLFFRRLKRTLRHLGVSPSESKA